MIAKHPGIVIGDRLLNPDRFNLDELAEAGSSSVLGTDYGLRPVIGWRNHLGLVTKINWMTETSCDMCDGAGIRACDGCGAVSDCPDCMGTGRWKICVSARRTHSVMLFWRSSFRTYFPIFSIMYPRVGFI